MEGRGGILDFRVIPDAVTLKHQIRVLPPADSLDFRVIPDAVTLKLFQTEDLPGFFNISASSLTRSH